MCLFCGRSHQNSGGPKGPADHKRYHSPALLPGRVRQVLQLRLWAPVGKRRCRDCFKLYGEFRVGNRFLFVFLKIAVSAEKKFYFHLGESILSLYIFVSRYFLENGTLHIDSVNYRDQGVYTCVAKTPVDRATASALLMVLGGSTSEHCSFFFFKGKPKAISVWQACKGTKMSENTDNDLIWAAEHLQTIPTRYLLTSHNWREASSSR